MPTGYAGTVKRVENFHDQKLGKRIIKVRLNADVEPGLNWIFRPHTTELDVRTGFAKKSGRNSKMQGG